MNAPEIDTAVVHGRATVGRLTQGAHPIASARPTRAARSRSVASRLLKE